MLVFGHFFIVPIGYLTIYIFLRKHNKKRAGKNWKILEYLKEKLLQKEIHFVYVTF